MAEIKQIDLMKSGKLTYLGELKKINGKYYVKVLCECGTENMLINTITLHRKRVECRRCI